MKITTPFTDEQVENLNKFQRHSHMHPFTCKLYHDGENVLVATTDGWICPHCEYTQYWSHDFMADGSFIKDYNKQMLDKGFI
jgi:hypothetical protein